MVLAALIKYHGYSVAKLSLEGATDRLEGLCFGDNSGELDFMADIEDEKVFEELRLHRLSMSASEGSSAVYFCEIGCMDLGGALCVSHGFVSHCE